MHTHIVLLLKDAVALSSARQSPAHSLVISAATAMARSTASNG